jgi:hypothetical protein
MTILMNIIAEKIADSNNVSDRTKGQHGVNVPKKKILMVSVRRMVTPNHFNQDLKSLLMFLFAFVVQVVMFVDTIGSSVASAAVHYDVSGETEDSPTSFGRIFLSVPAETIWDEKLNFVAGPNVVECHSDNIHCIGPVSREFLY